MFPISARAASCFPFTINGRTLMVTIAATMAINARTAVNSTREKAGRKRQEGTKARRHEARGAFAVIPFVPAFLKYICGLQQRQDRRQRDESDQRDQRQNQQR